MGLDALWTYCETDEDRRAVNDWYDGKRPDFPLMEREWKQILKREAEKAKAKYEEAMAKYEKYSRYVSREDEFEQ